MIYKTAPVSACYRATHYGVKLSSVGGGASVFTRFIYRNYNAITDVCFWIMLFAFARTLAFGLSGHSISFLTRQHPVGLAIGIAAVFSQLSLMALIFFRRFRDEYAERLWQQAARSFVKVILLLPFLWMGGWIFAGQLGGGTEWLRAHPDAQLIPQHGRFPNPKDSVGLYQFEVLNFAVLKTTSYFPLIFAGLYKWHRWRDERG